MAEIIQNGAPTKYTVGNLGDIYINSNTGNKYKCVAIYKIRLPADNGFMIEHEWSKIENGIVIDTELDSQSANAISNMAVFNKFAEIYSDDSSDLTTSYKTINQTLGLTVEHAMNFTFKHIKLGKIHFVLIDGGAKIYNTNTAEYKTTISISLPAYIKIGYQLFCEKNAGITVVNNPTFLLNSTQCTINLTYIQPNSTSQYSPDSIYQIKSVIMLIEH